VFTQCLEEIIECLEMIRGVYTVFSVGMYIIPLLKLWSSFHYYKVFRGVYRVFTQCLEVFIQCLEVFMECLEVFKHSMLVLHLWLMLVCIHE